LTAELVTPVPLTFTVVLPTTKFVPVKVTVGVVPTIPLVGEIEVNVGGTITVNSCVEVVPALVFTVTKRAPGVAFEVSVNVAMI
jgi:hypothetical protein